MCEIVFYYVVFPDRTRERRQRSIHCHRGTRNSLCNQIQYRESLEERPATQAEIAERFPVPGSEYRTTSPPGRAGYDEMPPGNRKGKGRGETPQGADVEHKGVPFSRYFLRNKRSPSGKKQWFLIRNKGSKDRSHTPSTPSSYSRPGSSSPKQSSRFSYSPESQLAPEPHVVEIEPKPSKSDKTRLGGESRTRPSTKTVVKVHNPGTSKSPSPPLKTASTGREHSRQGSATFTTPNKAYEEEKEKRRQKEEREFERRREEAREKEERRKWEKRNAEEQREAYHRARAVALEQEAEEAARRQEEKRRGKKRASYHASNDEGETEEQMYARQAQQEEDVARITEANRRRAEQERLERLRQASIPRRPRHGTVVHNSSDSDDSLTRRRDSSDEDQHGPGDIKQRGDRFFRSAIQTERDRSAERRAPSSAWDQPYRGDDGRRRRSTFDETQHEENNGRDRRKSKRGRKDGNGGGHGRGRTG